MNAFRETTYAGFRVLELATSALVLRCVPELGGRIFSLVSRRSDREWLWRQPDGNALFQPANPRDFATGTFAGLDECLPTIGACVWNDGTPIADHGEIWAAAWRVEEFSAGKLALSVAVPAFGLTLCRVITVTDDTVRFDYRLSNDGPRPAPALWAMHPLFAFQPGDRLELPPQVRRLRVGNVRPDTGRLAGADGTIPFPEISPGVFLDGMELPDSADGWLKAFTDAWPAPTGQAAVRNAATGDALRVRWDARGAPYLGLWLTRGGYRGWHHVALEPTNAPYDRVDEACAHGCTDTVTLGPGSQRIWWVEWRFA